MKKLLVLLLVLVMAFSFAACDTSENIQGEIIPVGDATPTATATANADETVIPTPTATAEPSDKGGFGTGSTSGTKYVNEFIGISCTLDSSWVFKTDAEIKEINEQAMDMSGLDYSEALENATMVYGMMATNANQTDTVSLNLEKLSGADLFVTEKAYLENTSQYIKEPLETMGLTNVTCTVGETTFAGETRAAIFIEGEINGIKMYETLVAFKCEGYMINVAACTWQENLCGDILAKFTKI